MRVLRCLLISLAFGYILGHAWFVNRSRLVDFLP